jgi:hypothetical protein
MLKEIIAKIGLRFYPQSNIIMSEIRKSGIQITYSSFNTYILEWRNVK